jgi:hypothetical protein
VLTLKERWSFELVADCQRSSSASSLTPTGEDPPSWPRSGRSVPETKKKGDIQGYSFDEGAFAAQVKCEESNAENSQVPVYQLSSYVVWSLLQTESHGHRLAAAW